MSFIVLLARPSLEGMPAEVLSKICEELWLTSNRPSYQDIKQEKSVIGQGTPSKTTAHIYQRSPEIFMKVKTKAWIGLCSLALISKKCHEVASTFIYKEVSLFSDSSRSQQSQMRLVATLLKNQKLARLVKIFCFDYHYPKTTDVLRCDRIVWEEAFGVGPHAGSVWEQLDHDVRVLIVLELLLMRLENLGSLDLDLCWNSQTLSSSALMQTPRRKILTKLRHFQLFGIDEFNDMSAVGYVHTLLANTPVGSVSIDKYYDIEIIENVTEGENYTTLKHLALVGCVLSKNALERMVSRCPTITTFSYYADSNELSAGIGLDQRASAADAIEILQNYNKYLETLNLDVNCAWAFPNLKDIAGEEIHEDQTIPCLSGFPNLRTIWLNRFDLTPALRGDRLEFDVCDESYESSFIDDRPIGPTNFWEKMPKSLEVLKIDSMTTSIMPMLQRVPEMVVDGTLPNLQKLIINGGNSSKYMEICKAFEGHPASISFEHRIDS